MENISHLNTDVSGQGGLRGIRNTNLGVLLLLCSLELAQAGSQELVLFLHRQQLCSQTIPLCDRLVQILRSSYVRSAESQDFGLYLCQK
jgi:hypothetical protein